jgi:hypothetical protein
MIELLQKRRVQLAKLYKQQATGVLYTRLSEVDLLIKRYKRTHKQVDTLPTVASTTNKIEKEINDSTLD